jgi:hypothetical protein
MGRKSLMFLVLFLFSFSFVVAENAKLGTNNLQFTCTVNYGIPSNSATYNLSIYYPNGSYLVNNVQAQAKGQGAFNYTVNFPINGDYPVNSFCYDGSNGNFSNHGVYNVSPTGQPLSNSQSIVFGLIFLVIIIFLVGAVYGLNNAYKAEVQIFYICGTYLLLFCLFFVCWLFSTNYLYQTQILASIFWITWLIMGFVFFPFIIFIGGYLLKKQAEDLMTDELEKEGYSPEDSRSMAKRK